jgi:hypothetical protein
MRLGIMQPYFFPYLGYFSLIEATDRWIVFDTPQYIRRGWVNRNRVLTRGKDEWKYIRIPIVKAPQETPIHQMEVDESEDWRADLLRNLDYYRDHRAPHYEETIEFLSRAVTAEERNLSAVLTKLLRDTCEYLGMDRKLEVFSQMQLAMGPVAHPGDWALRISEALGAAAYINPPGGREIFEAREFAQRGIDLLFLTPTLPPYDQRRSAFVPGLSIVDALMWNPRSHVLDMVRQYSLSP